MARAGSMAGHGLLLIAGFALALGISEAGLRWRALHRATRPAPPVAAGVPVLTTMAELVQPHASGWFGGAPYRTNRFGFRGPEISETPGPGVVRIGVVGDSVTAGYGLSAEEAYPARLEEMLNREGSGRYEVFNLGVPGASLRYALARLADLGLRLQPRTVVYGFTLNDIEGPYYRELRGESAGQGPTFGVRCALAAPLHVERLACASWVSLAGAFFPGEDSYVGELRYNYLENRRAWNDFTAQLRSMKALTDRRGVCLEILIHEQLQGWRWPRPQRDLFDRVVTAAETLGIAVSDSREAFRGVAFEDVTLSAVDSHPNPVGHEILARTLYEGLAELPERCLRPPTAPGWSSATP